MDIKYYKDKYEPVFNSWYLKEKLGEGSYGKVFEIERKEKWIKDEKAALKVITIPQNEGEIRSVMADGMDAASVRSYYENFVEEVVQEFVLMSKLKGHSNIVSYEDHMVIEHENEIGWDILIRMELLTPISEYIAKNGFTRRDVIRLGIDMCKALELCQKYNIIHRDIKPQNIFVSGNGDFKLGDFGIARTLEQTSGMLSKKGTYDYMAPEIYQGKSYSSNVDIFSLGIVMYRYLNENRIPFWPAPPAVITHADREAAIQKRVDGIPIPKPSKADGRLAEIVLKACSYDPKERYFAPMEMRKDLEAILYNTEEAKVIYLGAKGDGLTIPENKYTDGKGEEKPGGTKGIFGGEGEGGEPTSPEGGGTEGGGTEIDGTKGLYGEKDEDGTKGDKPTSTGDGGTEGMFGKKNKEGGTISDKPSGPVMPAKKRSLKKRIIFASAGIVVCVLLAAILFNHSDTPTYEDTEIVEAWSNPIEVQISDSGILQSDCDILTKRLDAYGARYEINSEDGIIKLEKDALGESSEEILDTLYMITGRGSVKFDVPEGSDAAIGIDDIENAQRVEDEENNSVWAEISLNDSGAEKLNRVQSDVLYMYVDDILRCDSALFDSDAKEIVIDEEPSGFIGLTVSLITDGELSKSYDVVIDEKYGIAVEEETETAEAPTEIQEAEPPVTTSSGSSRTGTSSSKKTTSSTQNAAATTQEPVVQEQTVQEQTVQEQPAAEQSNSQSNSSASSNENNLPEFYMEFD